VRGVDLGHSLSAVVTDALPVLLAERGVLVFPGQDIGPAEHLAFARQMGEIKPPPDYFPEGLGAQGFPEIGVISTDNGLAYRSDQWHADVTWMANPPQYSVLHMQVSPAAGGDTLWSSQLAAYDWLSEPMKAFLGPLTAHHSAPSDPDLGHDHPVVTRHPRTGRKALFVNSVFTRRINELAPGESDAVLKYLFSRAAQPELTCRWRWTEGDVAIWDNHFVQHYAVGDYHPATRRIHRVEIVGEPPLAAT
jgi:taurine dioxygenase